MSESRSIPIRNLSPTDLVVGYVAYFKMIDKHGDVYYAARNDGLSDVEKIGCAVALSDDIRTQWQNVPIE